MPRSVISSDVITEIFIGISCTVCSRLFAVTMISSIPCAKIDEDINTAVKIKVSFFIIVALVLKFM